VIAARYNPGATRTPCRQRHAIDEEGRLRSHGVRIESASTVRFLNDRHRTTPRGSNLERVMQGIAHL
jgi:hypothetical protein